MVILKSFFADKNILRGSDKRIMSNLKSDNCIFQIVSTSLLWFAKKRFQYPKKCLSFSPSNIRRFRERLLIVSMFFLFSNYPGKELRYG